MTNHGGCFVIYKLGEGNFKLLVISISMMLYIVIGALVFQVLEDDNELVLRKQYTLSREVFLEKYPDINTSDLELLLNCHAEAAMRGHLPDVRRRWDFMGSIYFVCTLVSTIGFGMTTPSTVAGRLTCIIYGFFGCAGSILTFNTFLERIIVLWTVILRFVNKLFTRIKKLCTPNVVEMESGIKPDDDEWKPTIARLLFVLALTVAAISTTMSALYMYLEDWTYLDSLYFCFVTFATIGFGDFVTHQRTDYVLDTAIAYSICNALIIFIGCASMYSLLNITSILIKELLSRLVHFITRRCRSCYYDPNIPRIAAKGRRRQATFFGFREPKSGRIVTTVEGEMDRIFQTSGAYTPASAVGSRLGIGIAYPNGSHPTTEETTVDSNYDTASFQSDNKHHTFTTLHTPHSDHNALSPTQSYRADIESDFQTSRRHSQFDEVPHLQAPIINHRHLVRLESFASVDLSRVAAIDLNNSMNRRRHSRPKSYYVNKRQVGSINVLSDALHRVKAVNKHNESSESSESSDDEDNDS